MFSLWKILNLFISTTKVSNSLHELFIGSTIPILSPSFCGLIPSPSMFSPKENSSGTWVSEMQSTIENWDYSWVSGKSLMKECTAYLLKLDGLCRKNVSTTTCLFSNSLLASCGRHILSSFRYLIIIPFWTCAFLQVLLQLAVGMWYLIACTGKRPSKNNW